MGTAYQEVSNAFNNAAQYANNASQQLDAFAAALNAAIISPPHINASWNDLAPPTLPTLPDAPALVDIIYQPPGGEPGASPGVDPGTVVFDTFTEPAPTPTLPSDVVVSFPTPAPTVPTVGTVVVESAPVLSFPPDPTYLTINTITMDAINLHPEWLVNLENIPAMSILAPTPYSYAPGPEYSSALLSEIQAKLFSRLQGGTGLDPTVEQAIWDRARDRETVIAQKNVDEVQRSADALGFQFPAGVLAAQLREAQQLYYDKLSGFSRDVALKQADLEQLNLRETIQQSIALESKLIDYSYQLEHLAFESAKQYADNAVQIHNAAVEQYKALLAAYNTYAAVYDTIIKGELAKVEVFKGELQGELIKSTINTQKVEQFKAQIGIQMAYVEIWKTQIGAATALISLEATKVNAAGEEIKAYTALINAETAKVENYKAQVQARVFEVDIYKAQVQAFAAKVGAQAEQSRAEIARNGLELQGYVAAWEGYKAKIQAESVRIEALGRQSTANIDGYRSVVMAIESEAKLEAGIWETQIKQYEASKQFTMNAVKLNADILISNRAAQLDAAKAGAQVYSQLTSSAYAMIHASAGISSGDQNQVSYNYGGEVSTTVSPVPIL